MEATRNRVERMISQRAPEVYGVVLMGSMKKVALRNDEAKEAVGEKNCM